MGREVSRESIAVKELRKVVVLDQVNKMFFDKAPNDVEDEMELWTRARETKQESLCCGAKSCNACTMHGFKYSLRALNDQKTE